MVTSSIPPPLSGLKALVALPLFLMVTSAQLLQICLVISQSSLKDIEKWWKHVTTCDNMLPNPFKNPCKFFHPQERLPKAVTKFPRKSAKLWYPRLPSPTQNILPFRQIWNFHFVHHTKVEGSVVVFLDPVSKGNHMTGASESLWSVSSCVVFLWCPIKSHRSPLQATIPSRSVRPKNTLSIWVMCSFPSL